VAWSSFSLKATTQAEVFKFVSSKDLNFLPFIRKLTAWFRGFPKQLVVAQVVWKLLASLRPLQDCPRHGTDKIFSTRID
jgi:hypothetical protein